jgi:hypothetical protein
MSHIYVIQKYTHTYIHLCINIYIHTYIHLCIYTYIHTSTKVEQGKECGLSLESFGDFKEGDEVQCYRVEWKSKPLKLQTTSADNRADYWAAAGAAASSRSAIEKEGIEIRM